MVTNNLDILQWQPNCVPTSKTVMQSDAFKNGWGRIVRKCQQGVSGLSKPPYQCSGIVSHQTSPFNIFENIQWRVQGDDNHFQRDLGIYNA